MAVGAIVAENLVLLLAGSLLLGFGNSSNLLSRYAAADLYPPERRASAIGIVVWGSTVGGVVGPNLVDPSGRLAAGLGLPVLAGPYLVPIALVGLAAILTFVRLRPDPYALAHESAADHAASVAAPLGQVFRRPTVVAAIVALVVGQFVMVLIMTMTPLHMTDHGHDLGAVGLVLSAHLLGMFALAPVSGRLTDRFGCTPVIYAGVATLALSALLAAIAPPDAELGLFVALFLLGFGWNLGFVAGSAMLSGGVSLAERTRIQGLADALIWSTSAIASLGSGVIVAAAGYTALGVVGAALVVVPAWVIWSRRDALRSPVAHPPFEPVGD